MARYNTQHAPVSMEPQGTTHPVPRRRRLAPGHHLRPLVNVTGRPGLGPSPRAWTVQYVQNPQGWTPGQPE